MEEKEFYTNAQNVCDNAISILLEYWKTEAGNNWDVTMKETIIGLNDIKQHFICKASE